MTATDPFGESVSDELSVRVRPSIQYVLNIVLQVLGPLISVISIIRYRYLIYLYFFKDRYIDCREESVRVGQKYQKQIPVLGDKVLVSREALRRVRRRGKIEKLFCDKRGRLQRELVIQEMVNEETKKVPLEVHNCVLTNYLLERDSKTRKILDGLRTLRQTNSRDWYLDYVEVDHSSTDAFFPDLRLRESEITSGIQRLMKLFFYSGTKYDRELLNEGLISQALGIRVFSTSDLTYSSGVSLHVQNNEIHCIRHMNIIPEESGCRKFFKLNHQ